MTDMVERVSKAIEGVEYFLNGSTVPTRIGPAYYRRVLDNIEVTFGHQANFGFL